MNIILILAVLYILGIAAWIYFSMVYLIPEGSKRGLKKAMQDPDYLDDVIGPSQARLVKFMRKEFPMLGTFDSDKFIVKIECRVRDQIEGSMKETMQSIIDQVMTQAAPGPAIPMEMPEVDMGKMFQAYIMKSMMG